MKLFISMLAAAAGLTATVSQATTLKDAEKPLENAFAQVQSLGGGFASWASDKWYFSTTHVSICVVTGSEKIDFLNKIKKQFEADHNATVQVVSMGSLEGADVVSKPGAVAKETCVPNIWSPASSAYEQLVKFNLSRTHREFLLSAPQTVKSPIVLALRGKTYRALKKAGAFKVEGKREYFKFQTLSDMVNKNTKIIVTRPGKSNSGFLSLLLAIHESKGGDTDSVGPDDVDVDGLKIATSLFPAATRPAAPQDSDKFNSSGDLWNLFIDPANALTYQGILTYESLVVNSVAQGASGIHVVYPETNAMSDHPAFVLSQVPVRGMSDEDKSYADHQDKLAKKFVSYMLEPAQQKEAAAEGFRPGVPRSIADVDVSKIWMQDVFSIGVAPDLGDDVVILPRKIDGETIPELKDAADKVAAPVQ